MTKYIISQFNKKYVKKITFFQKKGRNISKDMIYYVASMEYSALNVFRAVNHLKILLKEDMANAKENKQLPL